MLADPKNSEAGVTCSFCSSGKVEKIAPLVQPSSFDNTTVIIVNRFLNTFAGKRNLTMDKGCPILWKRLTM